MHGHGIRSRGIVSQLNRLFDHTAVQSLTIEGEIHGQLIRALCDITDSYWGQDTHKERREHVSTCLVYRVQVPLLKLRTYLTVCSGRSSWILDNENYSLLLTLSRCSLLEADNTQIAVSASKLRIHLTSFPLNKVALIAAEYTSQALSECYTYRPTNLYVISHWPAHLDS